MRLRSRLPVPETAVSATGGGSMNLLLCVSPTARMQNTDSQEAASMMTTLQQRVKSVNGATELTFSSLTVQIRIRQLGCLPIKSLNLPKHNAA
jgi:hypothetical protein